MSRKIHGPPLWFEPFLVAAVTLNTGFNQAYVSSRVRAGKNWQATVANGVTAFVAHSPCRGAALQSSSSSIPRSSSK